MDVVQLCTDLLKILSSFLSLLVELGLAFLVGIDVGCPHLGGIVQVGGPLGSEGVPLVFDVGELFPGLGQHVNELFVALRIVLSCLCLDDGECFLDLFWLLPCMAT